jgi:hypothetical protein
MHTIKKIKITWLLLIFWRIAPIFWATGGSMMSRITVVQATTAESSSTTTTTPPTHTDRGRRRQQQQRRKPPPPPPLLRRDGVSMENTETEDWRSSTPIRDVDDAVPSDWWVADEERRIPMEETANDRSTFTYEMDANPRRETQQRPPPPPPPPVYDNQNPPPPIHYSFPVRKEEEMVSINEPAVSSSLSGTRRRRVPSRPEAKATKSQQLPKYASARTDAVTRFQSSSVSNRLKLTASCGLLGAGCGAFLSKSISVKKTKTSAVSIDPLVMGMATLFIITSRLRNPYGELIRTLGLLFIRIIQRSRYIRKKYPGVHYVLPALALTERRPYPMSSSPNNPWKINVNYDDDDDDDFSMWYAILANLMMGGILLGGSHIIPFLPTSLASLLGASVLGYATTLPDSRGDLARVMGMRVVGILREAVALNSELHVLSKSGIVISNVLDKLLILDRQHRIKDKFLAIAHFVYDRVILRVQADMQQANDDDNDDDEVLVRPPSGGARRRRPPPMGTADEPSRQPRRPTENWNRLPDDASTQQQRPSRHSSTPLPKRDKKKRGIFSFFSMSRSSDDDAMDNNLESRTIRRPQQEPNLTRGRRPPSPSNRYQDREPLPTWNEEPQYADEQRPPIDDPYDDVGSREYFNPE